LLLFLLLVTFVNNFLLLKVHLLLLFVTFFTTCNFCKLLFTIEGGKVSCFNFFFIVQGEGVHLYLFILISFTVEGEGVEVNVFFSPIHMI
jgi:hypothetical protein